MTAFLIDDRLLKGQFRKGDSMTQKVALSCEKCGARNYHVPAAKDSSKRMKLKKYCSHCNEHTLHKQTR